MECSSFFFSSRRRHTRYWRDWSSDVCSSDLLHRHVGLVLQEPTLFRASIRDNIAYGRPDAPDEDVVRAAEVADAHEFIVTLPAGYDTVLAERGASLSGGQRQRLALARARKSVV